MKKVLSLIMVAVLAVMIAVPAFAADGVSAKEQTLLDNFMAVVNEHIDIINKDIAAQYEAEATNALIKVELDDAACPEFQAAIDAVDAICDKYVKGDSKQALAAECCKVVNAVANKYNMNVTVAKDGYATVTVTDSKTGKTDEIANNGSIVKQTGYGMAATYAFIVVIGAAVVGGAIVIGKKKLTANR